MLRALWFFFQLAIVVCAAIWIASQKGAVDIAWNDYTISVNLGVFLLFLTLFTIIAVAFFRICGAIVSAPGSFSRRRREKARKKGFQSLTRGFVAIAAGDSKKATQYAREVRNMMPEEQGLPLLLEAQAARLRGEEQMARESFEKLLKDKDAAFFGIRGLLKSSLDEGDAGRALVYAKTALEQNPKQGWILKSVYDLELRNRHYQAAFSMLDRVRKAKAIDELEARKDEVSLLLLLAEQDRNLNNETAAAKKMERAVKLDPYFVPAVAALSEHYLAIGKPGKVGPLVEKAWKAMPHPELAALWAKIAPEPKANDPMRRLRWMEKLVTMKPDNADAQIAAARAAIECGLWGEGRAYLSTAESLRQTAGLYRVRAELEEQAGQSAESVRAALEKASSAAPDAVWFCSLTGHIYERWAPVAEPHGSFNTITWGHPFRSGLDPQTSMLSEWKDPLLIERV